MALYDSDQEGRDAHLELQFKPRLYHPSLLGWASMSLLRQKLSITGFAMPAKGGVAALRHIEADKGCDWPTALLLPQTGNQRFSLSATPAHVSGSGRM
jgi:hypothetical protein